MIKGPLLLSTQVTLILYIMYSLRVLLIKYKIHYLVGTPTAYVDKMMEVGGAVYSAMEEKMQSLKEMIQKYNWKREEKSCDT